MNLTSSRAKFERARVHRSEFLKTGLKWLERHEGEPFPMGKRVEPWKDGGEVVIYSVGRFAKAVPDEIAAIVGDALFDYRAALDHLAWLLVPDVEKAKGRVADIVSFPLSSFREKFPDQFRRTMPGVDDVTRSIVARHQPFQNGAQSLEHPLAILHDWNRFDKHRVLPVMLVNATNVIVTVPEDFKNFEVIDTQRARDPQYLLPGMDLVHIYGHRRKPGMDHSVLIRVQAEVTIGHESGRPIEGVLDRIDTAVDNVLSEFERLP